MFGKEINNYIFMNEDEIDNPIYRIFSIVRFFEMIKNKEIVMVKPELWDDPFENPLANLKFESNYGEVVGCGFAEYIFGQCWSKCKESDAMWRIYSPDTNGVMVSTTPRKILKYLKSRVGETSICTCFIGKVQYKSSEDLYGEIESINILDSTGIGIAKTLLFKREAFSHEKEVRLIYTGEQKYSNCKIFRFEFEPNDLIEQIIFDPRMNDDVKECYSYYIEKLGYKIKIQDSELYSLPKKNYIKSL